MAACLVDKDALSEWPLANCALTAAGAAKDDAYYDATIKPQAYETCFRVAEQNCSSGINVVIVAPFTSMCRMRPSSRLFKTLARAPAAILGLCRPRGLGEAPAATKRRPGHVREGDAAPVARYVPTCSWTRRVCS